MKNSLQQFIAEHRQPLETALAQALPLSQQPHARRLNEALHYALFPGGKRWRPVLTLVGARLCGGTFAAALPAACAMEFLHTSSIIVDDLPAMDDAETRRNRAALHRAHGEDVATLAALALMNSAYALLASGARANGQLASGLSLIEDATRCIGSDGMIGGQMVDLELKDSAQGFAALTSRNLKTTALLELTMTAGARSLGASDDDLAALREYGAALGMAYQICDDLLDEFGEAQQTGKPARQDARHTRASFVSELGHAQAHAQAHDWVATASHAVRHQFGERPEVEWLIEAATQIVSCVSLPPPAAVAVATSPAPRVRKNLANAEALRLALV